MTIIEELTQKYNLKPNSYLTDNIWKLKDGEFLDSAARHKQLQDKWKHKYGQGWYGIEMTDRLPVLFYDAVDDFLDWVNKNNPNFEIQQISQKFTWIKIYLDGVDEQTNKYCWKLTELLSDVNIMY